MPRATPLAASTIARIKGDVATAHNVAPLRFTTSDLKRLDHACRAQGISRAAFMRRAVMTVVEDCEREA